MSANSERVCYSEYFPFWINTANVTFFFFLRYAVMFLLHGGHAKILHGDNTMFCNRQLKISGKFLIKFLFLGLNVAKVTTFRCFSFFFFLFFFFLRFVRLYIFSIVHMNMYMEIKLLAMLS